ncbi:hypothetical protein PEP31012_02058 [Pandoraea eparura]|jgi:hypothetical protein|uniref:Uncharacterized protein n=1 Tax=Pandoraea eparura TaxID=2508291 RepID=A0A5E4UJE2_9BURK|nr:hypothetical protein PEP31012_02058 [Pandoraea eparura]
MLRKVLDVTVERCLARTHEALNRRMQREM